MSEIGRSIIIFHSFFTRSPWLIPCEAALAAACTAASLKLPYTASAAGMSTAPTKSRVADPVVFVGCRSGSVGRLRIRLFRSVADPVFRSDADPGVSVGCESGCFSRLRIRLFQSVADPGVSVR